MAVPLWTCLHEVKDAEPPEIRISVYWLSYCSMIPFLYASFLVRRNSNGNDDTALNALEVMCSDDQRVKPHDGLWGTWKTWAWCDAGGYITGEVQGDRYTPWPRDVLFRVNKEIALHSLPQRHALL